MSERIHVNDAQGISHIVLSHHRKQATTLCAINIHETESSASKIETCYGCLIAEQRMRAERAEMLLSHERQVTSQFKKQVETIDAKRESLTAERDALKKRVQELSTPDRPLWHEIEERDAALAERDALREEVARLQELIAQEPCFNMRLQGKLCKWLKEQHAGHLDCWSCKMKAAALDAPDIGQAPETAVKRECPDCVGGADMPRPIDLECSTCNGTGEIHASSKRECEACDGTGNSARQEITLEPACSQCNGTGEVENG
jgi:hypothetical protein